MFRHCDEPIKPNLRVQFQPTGKKFKRHVEGLWLVEISRGTETRVMEDMQVNPMVMSLLLDTR